MTVPSEKPTPELNQHQQALRAFLRNLRFPTQRRQLREDAALRP